MTVMHFNKGLILRSVLFDFLVAVASVAIAFVLCMVFGEGLVKYTADANKLSYLSRYYNMANKAQTGSELVDGITVITTSTTWEAPGE